MKNLFTLTVSIFWSKIFVFLFFEKQDHYVKQLFCWYKNLYKDLEKDNNCVSIVSTRLLFQLRHLEHPNIVRFVGACTDGPDDGKHLIITEYCTKGSLQVCTAVSCSRLKLRLWPNLGYSYVEGYDFCDFIRWSIWLPLAIHSATVVLVFVQHVIISC